MLRNWDEAKSLIKGGKLQGTKCIVIIVDKKLDGSKSALIYKLTILESQFYQEDLFFFFFFLANN